MGFIKSEERQREELEEFKRALLACGSLQRRKGDEDELRRENRVMGIDEDPQDKLVCVTSGVSYLGLALVRQLVIRGYSVRLMVDKQEDIEKIREMETTGERGGITNRVEAVMGKLTEIESLTAAFNGCRGVFHTSAFADPAGLSGYSKSMAEMEVRSSENVIEACARTPSVRKCVLTSSLLACIWRENKSCDLTPVINHECWSDEQLCTQRRLWYALGKLRAEKAAWRVAQERRIRLSAICPGLITGPDFCRRNSTPTIAYLKGAEDMYANGLLATVDVSRLAEAHICVLEALCSTEFGRYICYDRVVETQDEAERLAQDLGMPTHKISGHTSGNGISQQSRFHLSNVKLNRLMSRTMRSCYGECCIGF
ncbi:3-beta hydroxysteroid dehydrogenase/isomerase [Dillenia turbinata]|uniref:3-beta hydroxysteroid dehydrogenase/isomerase n=1 Tax=Dillenia turbinata TaxID=194707 RepID=A0AAN8UM63_9MAGN